MHHEHAAKMSLAISKVAMLNACVVSNHMTGDISKMHKNSRELVEAEAELADLLVEATKEQ